MKGERLKSAHWLDAYRSRLAAKLIPFYLIRKGDPDAGTIFLRIANTIDDERLYTPQYDYQNDRREWQIVALGEAIAPYLAKLDRMDPDYWLLDVEKGGEEELFSDGL